MLKHFTKNQKEYFNNLNIKRFQIINFWKSIKPFFSDKGASFSKITLVEGNDIVSNEEEIANIMNDYFTNVIRTLNLKKHFSASNGDPSEFESHINIKMIHEKYLEIISESFNFNPVDMYMFKVSKRNTRTRCEICSKLTIKTPERHQSRRSGVFIVNFEHISHLTLRFLLLTLSR